LGKFAVPAPLVCRFLAASGDVQASIPSSWPEYPLKKTREKSLQHSGFFTGVFRHALGRARMQHGCDK
jgi:hypothetical protein